MTIHTRRFAGCGGIGLAADVGGEPAHPPAILMHGGGQTRHSWRMAARSLVRMGYHVISLDLRGHGESDWAADGDYSIDAFVADLKAIAATLSAPVTLVGASLGGVVSLLALGESSEIEASALILVDIVPRMRKEGVDRIRDFMSGNPEGFATVDEAVDAVARYLPNRSRSASSEGLKKNLRAGADGRLYWHWDPQLQAQMRTDVEIGAVTRRMDAAARNIAVPTLIVRGKASDVVSAEAAAHLQRLMRNARCVDVEDAGHMVVGDKNDKFNAAVEHFLDAVASAGKGAATAGNMRGIVRGRQDLGE
jgi:non-heme chloroperoxidase